MDNWLEASSIRCIALAVYLAVPVRIRRRRMVAEALHNQQWIRECSGALGMQAILEYLQLWSLLSSSVQLLDRSDAFIWRWEASGAYSSKSAYCMPFVGRIAFQSEPVWKTLAPPKCRYFIWLVAMKRCWTIDRLRSRGLPHPYRYVLCDQHDESIDHILVACPESRQLWWGRSLQDWVAAMPARERRVL